MEESQHFESFYPEDARAPEIGKILDFVKSGRSCQTIGIPGIGRGSLLGLLSYNRKVRLKHLGEKQKSFHFVCMDFSEVRKRVLYDVIKFMLISTAYSLLERNMQIEYRAVNGFLKEAIGFADELILFQALKKSIDYLANEKELSVVFLFDRFEQYIPNISEEFFLNLKILRNRAKYRFACVFSQNRPLEDILEPSVYSEFHEYFGGNNVFVNIYDPKGLAFRFSYLEKITGKKADEKTKNEIIKLSGGHGKIARLAYEAVLSTPHLTSPPASNAANTRGEENFRNTPSPLRGEGRDEGEEVKVKSLEDFLLSKSTIKGALFEIWNQLNPSEQNFIKNLVSKKAQDESSQYLENIGLVKDKKVTIPLLRKFIENLGGKTEEKLIFDAERNEILKGAEPITEKLSPSEFRLLKFLMQNPQRVCEKDEVITNVWKQDKTREGVTDQALDQIVYRLRKKIEDDPNNPVHILTVKGRGFKFAP